MNEEEEKFNDDLADHPGQTLDERIQAAVEKDYRQEALKMESLFNSVHALNLDLGKSLRPFLELSKSMEKLLEPIQRDQERFRAMFKTPKISFKMSEPAELLIKDLERMKKTIPDLNNMKLLVEDLESTFKSQEKK